MTSTAAVTVTDYLIDSANPHFGTHTTGIVKTTRRDTFVRASISFDTVEQRDAIAAEFPKFTKVRATTLSGVGTAPQRPMNGRVTRDLPMLTFDAVLAANGVNGGTNEAGLKRLAAFDRTIAKLGLTVIES